MASPDGWTAISCRKTAQPLLKHAPTGSLLQPLAIGLPRTPAGLEVAKSDTLCRESATCNIVYVQSECEYKCIYCNKVKRLRNILFIS